MICKQCGINKQFCVKGLCPMCLEEFYTARRDKLVDLIEELLKELKNNPDNTLTETTKKLIDYKKLV